MSPPRHSQDWPGHTRNDPIRREAYERAMTRLLGRQGVCETLTADQSREIQSYDGPEISGSQSDVDRRSRN